LTVQISRLDRPSATDLAALESLLRDAVENGASVGFVLPVDNSQIRAYWQGVANEVRDGSCLLLALLEEGMVTGSVQLSLCMKPNGMHRAELRKMLVHSRYRRRGFGRALMQAAEDAAIAAGRRLIVLDTESRSEGHGLYAAVGYRTAGEIPNYALGTRGGFSPTTFMYKEL
jgi:ribosomal protein S18 acetylase RimI-like enzyme